MASIHRRYDLCIRRLKALSAIAVRLVRDDNSAAVVDAKTVLVLASELQELLPHVDAGALACAWFVLGRGHLVDLVSLYSVALRRSVVPERNNEFAGDRADREAFNALRAALTSHLARIPCTMPDPYDASCMRAMTLSCALLRCGTLDCFSALLAGSVAELEQHMAGPPPRAPAPSRKQEYPACVATVLSLLDETCMLLEVLVCKDRGCERGRLSRLLFSKGGLLEHWARGLLLLYHRSSYLDGVSHEAARLLWRMGALLCKAIATERRQPYSDANASLSYLFSSHLVQLAAVLDGGSTYGMRGGSAVLPLSDVGGSRLSPGSGGERPRPEDPLYVDTCLAQAGLAAWQWCLNDIWCAMASGENRAYFAISDDWIIPPSSPVALEECRRALAHARLRLQEADAAISAGDGDARPGLNGFGSLDISREIRAHRVSGLEDLLRSLSQGVPPLILKATWQVAMRLAAAAVRAMLPPDTGSVGAGTSKQLEELRSPHEHQPQPQPQGPPPSQPQPQQQQAQPQQASHQQLREHSTVQQPLPWVGAVRPPPSQAVPLGIKALMCARAAMWNLCRAPVAQTSAPGLARLENWWGWSAQLVRAAANRSPREDGWTWRWSDIAELILPRRQITRGALSADLEVSLHKGGCLQLVELVMRRSGGVAGLNEERCFSALLTAMEDGPHEDGCALLATLAKVLGTADRAIADALATYESVVAAVAATGDGGAAASAAAFKSSVVANARCHMCTTADAAADAPLALAAQLALFVSEFNGLPHVMRNPEAASGGKVPTGRHQAHGNGRGNVAMPGETFCAHLSRVAAFLLPAMARLMFRVAISDVPVLISHPTTVLLSWVDTLAAHATLAAGDAAAYANKASHIQSRLMEGLLDADEDERVLSAAAAELTAASASSAATAAQWERLLWEEMDLPCLLGLALWRIEEDEVSSYMPGSEVAIAFTKAMWALMFLAPDRLKTSLLAGPQAGEVRSGTRTLEFSLQRVRQVLGPGRDLPEPILLANLEALCTSAVARVMVPVQPTDTAWYGGEGGAASATAVFSSARLLSTASEDRDICLLLLTPPEEVRAAVPLCGNPRCTSLAGDSEAGKRLMGCARCGGRVRYCCRECQVAHWKAGHKVECAGGLGAGDSGPGPKGAGGIGAAATTANKVSGTSQIANVSWG